MVLDPGFVGLELGSGSRRLDPFGSRFLDPEVWIQTWLQISGSRPGSRIQNLDPSMLACSDILSDPVTDLITNIKVAYSSLKTDSSFSVRE